MLPCEVLPAPELTPEESCVVEVAGPSEVSVLVSLVPLVLLVLLVLLVSLEVEDVPVSRWKKTRPSAAVVPKATRPTPLTIAAAARLPRVRMSIGVPLSS
ncbi:hypothetical protein GCM10022288_09200 [Gryllotalpicola kribbensis]|uniref:Uncharacterized protein n=1 Tax=Gryllotalpicola kribbensis TaxID=993084 RepID=A0ABP8ALV7_9MICO